MVKYQEYHSTSCPACHQTYQLPVYRPMIICFSQHVICLKCVKELSIIKSQCPTCKEAFSFQKVQPFRSYKFEQDIPYVMEKEMELMLKQFKQLDDQFKQYRNQGRFRRLFSRSCLIKFLIMLFVCVVFFAGQYALYSYFQLSDCDRYGLYKCSGQQLCCQDISQCNLSFNLCLKKSEMNSALNPLYLFALLSYIIVLAIFLEAFLRTKN